MLIHYPNNEINIIDTGIRENIRTMKLTMPSIIVRYPTFALNFLFSSVTITQTISRSGGYNVVKVPGTSGALAV